MDKPTPYSELNSVLVALVDEVRARIGEKFVGAYLQGSFAVGDFDANSDADFIIVTSAELSAAEVAALTTVHEDIYRLPSPWAQHLEGSYFSRGVLRTHRPGEEVWYVDHGSQVLVRSDHCNTLVVRWIVRENGITLAGPAPATLIDPIPVEALRREISTTLHDWGKDILADPDQYRNQFYQGFIVLSYCRMLHDLLAGRPSSKLVGADWAKTHLGPEWAPLIDRAWNTRPDPAGSVRTAPDPADFEETLRLVDLIMQEAETYSVDAYRG